MHDGHGVGAIADKVAQQRQLLRPLPLRVRETGLQRLEVGMDIGQQGKFHGNHITLTGVILLALACQQLAPGRLTRR